jgi:hypothetical protein
VSLPILPGKLTAGDQRPDLTGSVPYDATGYAYSLSVKRPDGSLLVKAATVAAYNSTTGTTSFSFAWAADDLQAGDRQVCEIIEYDASNKPMTWPLFLLNVKARNA